MVKPAVVLGASGPRTLIAGAAGGLLVLLGVILQCHGATLVVVAPSASPVASATATTAATAAVMVVFAVIVVQRVLATAGRPVVPLVLLSGRRRAPAPDADASP